MRAMLCASLLLVVACTKSDNLLRVDVRAECRMCSAEWADREGVVHRDTIIGLITWHDTSGVQYPDTARGTGHWNLTRMDGEALKVTVCHLRPDTADGDIMIAVGGDVEPFTVSADALHLCAVVDRPVFRQ